MSTSEPSSWFRGRKADFSIEEQKSRVRVTVTKIAAWWVFLGSVVLVVSSIWMKDATFQTAKDVFMTVLPVATGVITYWFASRGRSSTTKNQ